MSVISVSKYSLYQTKFFNNIELICACSLFRAFLNLRVIVRTIQRNYLAFIYSNSSDIVLMNKPKFLSTLTKIMALLIRTIETVRVELLQKCRPARQLHFTSHPRHTSTRNFRACTRFLHFVTYIFIIFASAWFPFKREPSTHFGIVDRFKNIFHDNNSRNCEKLIPKRRRRARPVECGMAAEYREKIFPV